MPTPHNEALKGSIAKIVLMSGDPLRAKYIAEKYLENSELVNDVRGMYAYTGFYKGKRITVMGHGMGMPSIGIYAYELFKFYDVEVIIRMGSCGSYNPTYQIGDTILTNKVKTLSNISKEILGEEIYELPIYENINEKIKESAKDLDIELKEACVTTVDVFDVYFENIRNNKNFEIVEMEAFGLFAMAKLLNKKCACLLTVVDGTFSEDEISPEDREKKLDSMIKVTLETTLKLN